MPEAKRTSILRLRHDEFDPPMQWEDICRRSDWQGRWLALDECAYNEAGEATSGLVVDCDDDLAELCARLSAERRQRCSIVFCPRAA
jgi:hypothetical protein